MEAMATATLSWVIAVGIGAIPLVVIAEVSFIDAYFETMSGFTTTGMSIFTSLDLPHSALFWRMFIQWIGGLGILTFFVTVLVESGGVATKLVSTEANKGAGDAIRPSLFNAIKSLWYVYIVLTVTQMLLLYHAGFPTFEAVTHAMATMPTGGFSTVTDFSTLMNPSTEAIFTVFMFLGGTNFLLIYSVMQGNVRRMLSDYEFRLYAFVTLLAATIIGADLLANRGMGTTGAAATSIFHTVSVLSSSGFEIIPVGEFPDVSRYVILILMFIGGSLGSTTGGIKMLRFGLMLKVIKQQIKDMALPPTVVNRVVVGHHIVRDDELIQVLSIIAMWALAVVAGGFLVVGFSRYGAFESVQLMTSAVGTMGPTFVPQAELTALHPFVKIGLMVGMLAGRLEMLPLLSLLNIHILKKFV